MISVDRDFLAGDAPEVAPQLLGLVLESNVGGKLVRGRVAEVEAYRQDDPASHTFGGPTPRNRTMFGPPGHLYVYLSYGIHRCANVVTGPEGTGAAVLLRALDPLEGFETIRERRSWRPDRELLNGPGKLCQALGIGMDHDGVDVCATTGAIRLLSDGYVVEGEIRTSRRVGITKAVDTRWRFRPPAEGSPPSD